MLGPDPRAGDPDGVGDSYDQFLMRVHRAFVAVLLSVLTSGACTHRGGAAAPRATPSGILAVAQRVEHLDVAGREPMVVEHPDGSLFVAGYGLQPRPTLWKSRDRGATWTRVDVGSEAQGAIGNSDVDLTVSRDGTLYFVNMFFDRAALEGRQIAIGVSRDTGATWVWTTLSQTRFDDRPWVAVAPDGAAHVIWNDGSGVLHTASRDRGVTWSTPTRIHSQGGSSHLAVGPHGEVAVRIVPLSASGNKFDPGVDLIAVSTDGGTTWEKRPPPGQRDWAQEDTGRVTPRWVEPLAWDGEGRLYALWTDTTGVWLARSADRGGTWTSWRLVTSRAISYYPYLVARGHGELAATWFSGVGGDLEWRVARLQVPGDSAAPRVIQSAPLPIEVWIPRGAQGDSLHHGTGGEYLGLAFLHDGGLGVVSPIQNPSAHRVGFTWWRFDAR